ncbi:AmmeMemoRadiSam system protein A [Candidatus Woesearchaeota archaeon]|jgi:uncharacterized protein|nr:AmmeMemoRadiSam system protein A [Candidatus Woesearchaeota archaeon]MBT5272018.1 AmmeMemoRadiSam system protein A [Candidatus Woesearchaeota archaeon]MBT6040759.1 AmmeMemoRadiSam system protein A [Candidatus Woesearchaeota archaeon]MBT6336711.1 AmmeMemoRadiSam system protein A [Candidatus Woesearchaeota archaeon]MBT7927344.1 AmmeMemoRadiSam system protein A [Candidatus Woesearchaeota archaeon]
MMLEEEKQYLLQLARKTIEEKLNGKEINLDEEKVPESLKVKKGCFVTLTSNGNLRGCIGHLLPVQELYKDVIENALSASFQDPRFPPLEKMEFKALHIEISVLDVPEKLNFNGETDLIEKLVKDKPGVILKKGMNQATFLPQVWDDLPKPEEFLTHLCMKAGLEPFQWKQDVEIETYGVEKFEE